MSPSELPLPMVVSGCALDERLLAGQLERYQQLAGAVTRTDLHVLGLTVTFSSAIDAGLLQETIAIEQGCCSFLTIDYQPSERTLSITADPGHSDVIAALAQALSSSTAAAAE